MDLPPHLKKRSREDFDFMVLCAHKGNMGLYHTLKDASLPADIQKWRETQAKAVAEAAQRDEQTHQALPERDELWDADPKCQHDIQIAPGGGVKCTKCRGWFCF